MTVDIRTRILEPLTILVATRDKSPEPTFSDVVIHDEPLLLEIEEAQDLSSITVFVNQRFNEKFYIQSSYKSRIFQKKYVLRHCSKFYIDCLKLNTLAVREIISSQPRLLKETHQLENLSSQPPLLLNITPLSMIVKFIKDEEGCGLVGDLVEHNQLQSDEYRLNDLDIGNVVCEAAEQGKRLMIESCFRGLCQPEMRSLVSIIQTIDLALAAGVSEIIKDYVGYIRNPKIEKIAGYTIKDSDQVITHGVAQYKSPIRQVLQALVDSANADVEQRFNLIKTARLLLDNGANLDARYQTVRAIAPMLSIRDRFKHMFSDGYLDRLASKIDFKEESSIELLSEFVEFKENKNKSRSELARSSITPEEPKPPTLRKKTSNVESISCCTVL